MAREQIYTGQTLGVADDGSEWQADRVPEDRKVVYLVRGFEINFAKDRPDVEVGVGLIDSHGQMTGDSHYTQVSEDELANLIRTLQRAGRVTFGASPW